jgi:hypothetical protein
MSRPKPTILMEYTDPKTYRSEQVLAATAIWAVFHEGKPINLKSQSSIGGGPGPKYKKVSFSNKGHALNLAIKLNKLFNTDKFHVYELSTGKHVK